MVMEVETLDLTGGQESVSFDLPEDGRVALRKKPG
jgi:hypothetical protein